MIQSNKNIGGATVIHELESIEALQNCLEAYQVFRDAGWLEYFQRLEGSDEAIEIKLAKNLNDHET